MKTKLFILMIVIILFTSGCASLNNLTNKPEFNIKKDITKTEKIIEKTSNTIEKASTDVSTEAYSINKESINIENKIPTNIKPEISPHLDSIKKSSDSIIKNTIKINKATAELSSVTSLLDNIKLKIITTEDALDKIAKERDNAIVAKKKAEEERDSALHKAIKWLILASIVGAAALGVFGFMYNNKLSLTLSATCIVIMSIAIFVGKFLIYLAIGGGLILAALVGLMMYNIIIQKKAFKEVVETVEIAQDKLTKEDKNKLFGGDGETGVMKNIQSKSTKSLVKIEKKKISNLWNYAKNK